MALSTLRLSHLLALSPAERLDVLGKAAREIAAEIEGLKESRARIWYGYSRRSRRYRVQHLYARRQQLVALAHEAGCDGWEPEATNAT